MSGSDGDAGRSLLDASPQSAPEFIAPETDERPRERFWLVAIGCMLVAGAGLLFTSPPVISPGSGRSRRPRRKPHPKAASEPIVVKQFDEPHREPWWLLAFTICVIIGVGLLFIFYAHLPPFLHY